MESSLVVTANEVEPVIGPTRRSFDPYSGIGVPPHITLLYPFAEPSAIDDDVASRVAMVAGEVDVFGYRLTRVRAFPDAVYLSPDPAEPFVELTERLFRAFPAFPPFGGEFDTIVPHLTLGWRTHGAAAADIERRLSAGLPIDAVAREITLLVEDDDGWSTAARFPLRSREPNGLRDR